MSITLKCTVDKCAEPHEGLGYCKKHYLKLKRHGDPLYVRESRVSSCIVEGCMGSGMLGKGGVRYFIKGYCTKHYKQIRKYNTLMPSKERNPEYIGVSKHELYHTWHSMIARCHNKSSANYHKYGGRGIKVCDRWRESFVAFCEDMGERPEGTSIDRINGKDGYHKLNCRWADIYTQNNNRSLK